MSIALTLSHEGPLEFQPGLPTGYAGPILRGATAVSAKTALADMVIQELAGEDYSIRFSISQFFRKVTGSGHLPARGLYSYFMLKNGLRKEIDGIGRLHVRQDQYCCFYTEPTACRTIFEKNQEYRTIGIFYSPQLLSELLPFFPELKPAMETQGSAINEKTCWSLPAMKEITSQILNCPFDETTRRFYFDIKVRELLYQILENAYKRNLTHRSFTPWEIKRIHEARDILETYISKKPPLIRSLAKQVALNEFKLKAGFRQYFNSGIFEWLLERKMQYAKELVLTTNMPIKEICGMVGYPLTTNFITAFRRRFAVTPGALRRK